MGTMSWGDWFALAGVIAGVGTGFAIPAAIWMTKMYTGQRLITQNVRNVRVRVNRLEKAKAAERHEIATAIQHASSMFQERVDSNTDRINEHAEQISNHSARITTTESEVNKLRETGHQFKNFIQKQQDQG